MQAAETEIQRVSLSDSFVSLRRYRIWCRSSPVHCTLHAACRHNGTVANSAWQVTTNGLLSYMYTVYFVMAKNNTWIDEFLTQDLLSVMTAKAQKTVKNLALFIFGGKPPSPWHPPPMGTTSGCFNLFYI